MHADKQHERARHLKHTEKCRARIYQSMVNEGSDKMKNAVEQDRVKVHEPNDEVRELPKSEPTLDLMEDVLSELPPETPLPP